MDFLLGIEQYFLEDIGWTLIRTHKLLACPLPLIVTAITHHLKTLSRGHKVRTIDSYKSRVQGLE